LAILTSSYKNIGIDFTNENKFNKAFYYLDKFLHYNKNDIPALSSMALCCFKLNDLPSAKKYTETIGKIDKSSPFYILNQAFFGIYEKNYASALHFYKEISKRGTTVDPSIITSVIAFLDQIYRVERKEHAYEFAIGILNKHHCQHKEGLKELRRFVKNVKKKPQYHEMLAYADLILKT
jgi:tetratricopeptide (TPR) repeat protein